MRLWPTGIPRGQIEAGRDSAVVKADAYGLGIVHVVPALWQAGCRTFFVALAEEGLRVKAVAPDARVFVLNGFFAEAFPVYDQSDLIPVLGLGPTSSIFGIT